MAVSFRAYAQAQLHRLEDATCPADSGDLGGLLHKARDQRVRVERELAAALDVPFPQVVVYCLDLTRMKEAGVVIDIRRGMARLNDPVQDAFTEIGALQVRYAGL